MPILDPISRLSAVSILLPLLIGCGSDSGDPLDIDDDAAADLEIPVGEELQPWLAAGGYQELPAESGIHASTGPHGRVRSFVSPGLSDSLAAGGDHPRGVAAIKELYDGDTLNGWAVSVKIEDDSAGGEGWYWYEVFSTAADAEPAVDGTGVDGCTGCHASGRDYVRLPFPLE